MYNTIYKSCFTKLWYQGKINKNLFLFHIMYLYNNWPLWLFAYGSNITVKVLWGDSPSTFHYLMLDLSMHRNKIVKYHRFVKNKSFHFLVHPNHNSLSLSLSLPNSFTRSNTYTQMPQFKTHFQRALGQVFLLVQLKRVWFNPFQSIKLYLLFIITVYVNNLTFEIVIWLHWSYIGSLIT